MHRRRGRGGAAGSTAQPLKQEGPTKQGNNSGCQFPGPESFLSLRTVTKVLESVINVKLVVQRFIRGIQSRCGVSLGAEEGMGVAGEKRNSSETHLSGIKVINHD